MAAQVYQTDQITPTITNTTSKGFVAFTMDGHDHTLVIPAGETVDVETEKVRAIQQVRAQRKRFRRQRRAT